MLTQTKPKEVFKSLNDENCCYQLQYPKCYSCVQEMHGMVLPLNSPAPERAGRKVRAELCFGLTSPCWSVCMWLRILNSLSDTAGNQVEILLQVLEKWFLARFEPHLLPQVRRTLLKATLAISVTSILKVMSEKCGFSPFALLRCSAESTRAEVEKDIYFQTCSSC